VTTGDSTPSFGTTDGNKDRQPRGFRKFFDGLLGRERAVRDIGNNQANKPDGVVQQENTEDNFSSATAMRRLTYLGAGGCVLIFLFSFSTQSMVFPSLSVGLLIACAATMIGILIGFIFGVPF
jgi:hypothetical protein